MSSPEIDMNDSGISIECLERSKEILALKQSWDKLHKNCTSPSIYNGFDFIYESIRSFKSAKQSKKVFTLTDTTSGELIAIFPLQQNRSKWRFFRFNSYIYTAQEESDKPFPLIRNGYSNICWAAFLQHLKSNISDWEHLQLIEMPVTSEALDVLPGICKKLNLIYRVSPDAEAPMINLEGDWNEYWSQHRKKRKIIRKIEKDFSDRLKFTVYNNNWQWCIDQYIELEGKSWKKGKVGISKNKESITFHKRLFKHLGPSGNLHFGFLTIDDALISAVIGYTWGDTAYFCHVCYDDYYKKYSPGTVSISYFFKHFYESRYKTGDCLCGFAGYLNSWCDVLIPTNVIDIYIKNPKIRAMFTIRIAGKIIYNPVRNLLVKAYGRIK